MRDARGRWGVAAAAALATGLLVAPATSTRAASTTVVDTAAAWNGTSAIGPFGVPNTATYGQVVTVPATDAGLMSFSFHLQVPATTAFRAEVYAWDGSKATGAPLWASAATTTAGTGSFETVTFSPNGVRLVGGARYVLFLTTSLDGGSGTGRAAFDFAPYTGGEFVFLNNGADPSQWTTTPWVQRSPAQLAFTAEFGPGDLPPTASGVAVTATEGAAFSGTVATTSDADGGATDMSATVDWGDGTASTPATVVADGGGLDVQGSHTYAEEGSFTVTTTVRDVDAGTTATTTSTATVADAALTLTGGSVVAPASTGDVVLAHLADADPGGTAADDTATVDWGDGGGAVGATVTADPNGGFDVHGAHAYAATGPHTVTVHVCDAGGSCAEASTSLLTYGVVAQGAFVIGDRSTGTVTWWGPSWARDNRLSGGRTPRSFNGFEDGVTPPACGASWTAATGEDGGGRPPRSVPGYMAVIVASSVTRAGRDGERVDGGSVVDGNTVHVVVVHTNPGYGRHHDGTGTVVAVVC